VSESLYDHVAQNWPYLHSRRIPFVEAVVALGNIDIIGLRRIFRRRAESIILKSFVCGATLSRAVKLAPVSHRRMIAPAVFSTSSPGQGMPPWALEYLRVLSSKSPSANMRPVRPD
jgi:hypothetical protein